MAVQRKTTGSRKKCDVCGKPLYRPRTCKKCGGSFCQEHISSRKHKCTKTQGKTRWMPSRRILIPCVLCTVIVLSVLASYHYLPWRKEGMLDLEKRGVKVGPYLQYLREDLGKKSRLEGLAIRDLQILGGDIWAATSDGVFRLDGRSWKKMDRGMPTGDAYSLAEDGDGSTLAGCLGGVYALRSGEWSLIGDKIPEKKATALLKDGEGSLWLGTDHGMAVLDQGSWKWFEPTSNLEIRSIVTSRGLLLASSDYGLWRFSGGVWKNLSNASGRMGLLSTDVRGMSVNDMGDVWVCTAGGVNIFDGNDYYYSFSGENGLPYDDAYCVAFGSNGTVWIGTSIGICELREGRWHYYEGPRWMDNNNVGSLVAGPDWVWLGTSNGVSKIVGEWVTLEEKASTINRIIQQRHERDGYIEFVNLKGPADFSNWTYHASDNDGLWTSIYLAAESFRYAVTGDLKAKENAKRSYEAMKRLESLTGIRGFPARAAVRKGSRNVAKSGGEWHQSSVDPGWEWKGDTSSDEIDGHYFAYAIYYDLVADESEKKDVAALVSRITDHIIDHDYYLVDLDGKRTYWGVWNPKEINDDPSWGEEHGLNSLEILSHLKVAIHMTGKEKYKEAYKELIEKYHYHLNTINQKILPPGSVNHSDDELAFLAYYPIMLYEDDPALRAIYLKSIERSWQIERPERSPFFNFVYGAATNADFDLEESVEELKGMSPDLLDWSVSNSHRSDVKARLDAGDVFTLPFENRNMRRWNANPYSLEWGGSGQNEGDGAYFLMPYWMGRYHGFIIEG